jgi:hypothetical protein
MTGRREKNVSPKKEKTKRARNCRSADYYDTLVVRPTPVTPRGIK